MFSRTETDMRRTEPGQNVKSPSGCQPHSASEVRKLRGAQGPGVGGSWRGHRRATSSPRSAEPTVPTTSGPLQRPEESVPSP